MLSQVDIVEEQVVANVELEAFVVRYEDKSIVWSLVMLLATVEQGIFALYNREHRISSLVSHLASVMPTVASEKSVGCKGFVRY